MTTMANHLFALPVARSQSIATTVIGTLAATLDTWYSRSLQRQQLLRLEAAELSDMGISDSAARSEATKPFWQE